MFSSHSIKVLSLLIGAIVLCNIALPAQAATCGAHQFYSFGECAECDSSCDECTDVLATACLNCTNGYKKSYYSCSFTCSSSQYLDFNSQTCESCSRSCSRGCIEAGNNCNNCPSGTYYRPDTNKCNNTCPYTGGYYQSLSENRCIPCRDKNCLRCSSIGDCSDCKSFWHRNSTTGRCSWKCPTGCKYCTERGVCTQCESGWTKSSSGSCSCPYSNCRECGTTSCSRCMEGYVKDSSGTCRAVVSNCREYNSSTSCEICEPGYYLSSGFCYQCPSGCRHCNTGSNCTACENGYYMSFSANYTRCYLRTYQSSSATGWIIGLSFGGVVLCLIITSVMIAHYRKKRYSALLSARHSGDSSADYTQYNNTISAYPAIAQPGRYANQVIYHPPENHPQSHFYQSDQHHHHDNKVHYPTFN